MAHKKQFGHLKIKLDAIKLATNNFAEDNCIGKGGFGKVYIGKIYHSKGEQTMVALKRLDRAHGQGVPEFWKEVMTLSFYRHANIVSLLGYCDDSHEMILVYEYAPKKSLDLYLRNDELTWVQRLKICVGAARGLAYLHTPVDTQLRILHRDIKSSNILLDENWNTKISYFGLSKFGPANQHFTYIISNPVGTLGYCDPLYVETGLLTKESDVYSFGVVLFEVLCGRLCFDNNNDEHQPFIGLVRKCYEENRLDEIIYGNLKDEINSYSLREFTKIAYQCLSKGREQRPLMTDVVKALEIALRCQCSGTAGSGEAITYLTGILNVKVLRGINLKARKTYYVVVSLTNNRTSRSTKKTSVKHDNVNPEWNEEFTLYRLVPGSEVQIHVYNIVSEKMHALMYHKELMVHRLTPEKPHTLEADMIYHFSRSKGKVVVEVVYKPSPSYTIFEDVCPLQKAPIGTPQGGGLFVVIIHGGHCFKGKRHGNPYISLLFRQQLRKTVSLKNINHSLALGSLLWGEELSFMLEEPPTQHEQLLFEVISTRRKNLIYRKEEYMGSVNITVGDIVNRRRIHHYINGNQTYWHLEVELQWRTCC